MMISLGRLEAIHDAWRAAANLAEPGVPRLTFARGMKALRPELENFHEERDRITLECAVRDVSGALVPFHDDEEQLVPNKCHIADAERYAHLMRALHAQAVEVSLPALSDDLLCHTSADADALAILLDFVTPCP